MIFQSDDWGRVGLPSIDALEALNKQGLAVGRSPWDYYGLESESDLRALGELLQGFSDGYGNPPCFTANFVMANADLKRIEDSGFQKFHWVPLSGGFPSPWAENLVAGYQSLITKGLFYPGFHGFTHFNVPVFMRQLGDKSEKGEIARLLLQHDVPYLASITPEYNFALVDRCGGAETHLSESDQMEWFDRGIEIFSETFGVKARTFCAPGYRQNSTSRRLAAQNGIRILQTSQPCVPGMREGLFVLGRNVSFEPALKERHCVDEAVHAAQRAVSTGMPIIVCTHSINYISRFSGKAKQSLAYLSTFIEKLLVLFPDLRFSNDLEFFTSCACLKDSDRFRRPNVKELALRLSLFDQLR